MTNVYAPNNSNESGILWAKKIIQKLPRDCRRVFVGEWNMVGFSRDKWNVCE